MGGRVCLPAVLALLVCALVAAPAAATAPGDNGKIAFGHYGSDGFGEIFVMNLDGSGIVNVTNSPGEDNHESRPAWSPDGAQLAFETGGAFDIRNRGIVRMNLDGTGRVTVTGGDFNHSPDWSPDGTAIAYYHCIDTGDIGLPCRVEVRKVDGSCCFRQFTTQTNTPAWSPDGTKIAYNREGPGTAGVYTANPDGSGETLVVAGMGVTDWSPDGTRLLLVSGAGGDLEIYTISPNGTGLTQLTDNTARDFAASWSPDGTKIVFNSDRHAQFQSHIYTMNPDGSGQTQIGDDSLQGSDPVWQPIPAGAGAGPKNCKPKHAHKRRCSGVR